MGIQVKCSVLLNPDIMRPLIIFLLIFGVLSDLNSQVPACLPLCKRISLAEYAPGMIFYFPPVSSGSMDAIFASRIASSSSYSYNKFADKKYAIKDTASFRNKLYYDRFRPDVKGNLSNDRVQRLYSITMENVADTTDIFTYDVSVDSAVFLPSPPYPAMTNNAYVQGAIAWDEFEATKNWLLKLPMIYTLFEVDGKKYEKVKIIDVVPGSWETPLGIVYKSASTTGTIYLNLCGTNVPDTYVNIFHFSKYFTCDSPQGKIPNFMWTLIQSGKPDMNMSEKDILLTLGKPKQVEETVEKGNNKTVYTFEKYVVYFEKGAMVKFVSVKTN